jgi:hypothetical protein
MQVANAKPWVETRASYADWRESMPGIGTNTRDRRTDPEKPGLHVESGKSDQLRGDEHHVTYRKKDGTPLAYAKVHVPHDKGKPGGVTLWGRDPAHGMASRRAAIRVMKWAHERNSAHPLGSISKETARNYHHFMVRDRNQTHGDVPEHVLKDYGIKAKKRGQLELFPKTEKSWGDPLLVVFV